MTITEIQEKILTDDDFVLAEVAKLQYLYGLKYEIRYGLTRDEKDYTESVAEHVYGMYLLADYFLALEDTTSQLKHNIIRNMIVWHDIGELETGDVISWKKTETDIANEKASWEGVVQKVPEGIRTNVYELVEQYENLTTAEAKFVKAIDKVEPIFHLYNELGKEWSQSVKLTRHNAERIKTPYVADYPYIKRFVDVVHEAMQKQAFFSE